MTSTLYDLTAEWTDLSAALTESAGEITDEIEARLDALGTLEGAKVDSYALVVRSFEAHATACRAEATALIAKATVAENAAKRLKARLLDYLTARGLEELRGTIWKAKRTANGGKQPLTLLVDPDDLPPEYQLHSVTANTEMLRIQADDDGSIVFSGQPVARLEPRGFHLRLN
jgi:hypothetical protein